jgi:restriction endonuclease Mrr
MVDGDRMLEVMIQNGIGVLRRPLQLLDIDEDFFRERGIAAKKSGHG